VIFNAFGTILEVGVQFKQEANIHLQIQVTKLPVLMIKERTLDSNVRLLKSRLKQTQTVQQTLHQSLRRQLLHLA
jgi:hypothetical protein